VKSAVLAPILLSRSLIVIDNTAKEPSLDEKARSALRDFHVGSLMSAPLLLRGELVGRLVLTWPSERQIEPHDARMFHTVATQATAVAERIFLVDRYQREIQERASLEAVLLQAQQTLLRELGTPIIPVADDILLMPLIGTIDETRAQRITEVMLSGIVSRGAETAILDLSGVPTVTTQIADALLGVTRAVRLVGAEVVITGMRPDMAKTLVEGGATLEGFTVRSTVQSGIAFALAKSSARRHRHSRGA
jgi:anti-anti-sigma regulatory factor